MKRLGQDMFLGMIGAVIWIGACIAGVYFFVALVIG